jgi:hypothetical protein
MSHKVTCYLGKEDIDIDDPNADVWRAGSVFSRSGRIRSGGSKGGADRVLLREHEIYACGHHVKQLKEGRLGQARLKV